MPTLKHDSIGTVGMASTGENLNCSQESFAAIVAAGIV